MRRFAVAGAILPESQAKISEEYATIPKKFSEGSQAKEPRSEAIKAPESFSLKTDSMLENNSLPRLIILHLIAIIFVMLNVSDIRIAGLSDILPLFDMMAIFYFTVFKNVFAIWFVFLLGVWNDALNGNPLGATSLCYILLIKFFLLLNSKMLIRENFNHIWQQFAAFCFLFLLMKWVILSMFNGAVYSVVSPLVQFILSSVLYVVMHRFFDHLNSKLLEEN